MNPTDQPEENPLPSVEDVIRFMTDWRKRVQQIPWLENATLTCHPPAGGADTSFAVITWEGNDPQHFHAESPDQAIKEASEARSPRVKALNLRHEASKILKRAAELETAAQEMEVPHV